jgi:plasmid stability protein
MSQILVRDLQPEDVDELKEIAKANQRSLEAEIRVILHDIASRRRSRQASVEFSRKLREELEERGYSGDSTQMIREDRDR